MIMTLKQKNIKFKPRIILNHNIYVNKLMPHLILLNKDIFNRIGLKFKLAIKAH